MCKTFRRSLITGITLLMAVVSAFAGGRQEDPIRQARELVAENRINEAILLLEQTVRQDPERIQEAEALMRTIREIRGEYNVLFEQLIDNLVNNPDDIERTLQIIDQMEALDEFPNERVVEQVQDARIVAQLAFDRNVVDERMEEARGLLRDGEYLAAVDLYMSLRDLQRARFDGRGYGDIFVNTVDQVVTEIQGVAESFDTAFPPYRRNGNVVLAQAEGGVLTVGAEDLSSFYAEAQRMAEIVARADQAAQEIAVIRSQVALQFPDDPVDWYLNFQDVLTRGRSDFRGEEGLYYAVRRAYRDYVGSLADIAAAQTAETLEIAFVDADADRHAQAEEGFSLAAERAAFWEDAELVTARVFTPDPAIESVVEDAEGTGPTPILRARTASIAAENMADLSAIMAPFVADGSDRSETVFSLLSRLDATEATVNALRSGQAVWEQEIRPIAALPDDVRDEGIDGRINAAASRWVRAEARAVSRERDLAVALSLQRTEGASTVLAAQERRLTALNRLADGVEEQVGDDDATSRLVRRPDEALAGYREVATSVDEVQEAVETAQTELAAEDDYVLDGGDVREELDRLAGLQQRIASISSRVSVGITEAQELIAEAETLEDQGDDLIADTRAAIAAFRVDAARNAYADARDAFLESLQLREDTALRDRSDALIQQVGAELQELENVIVVRRVRELLTQAEELYNQDSYVAARDTVLAAQETWEQTNVDPNTEVERLLRLVTAALSLEEGRELSLTDPLYPILGNYMSIAREDFNEAQRLLNRGQTEAANRLFDRAIENLRNVRDVRPLNWDARILELRIAQIRNQDNFDDVFAARYQQAVARLDDAGPLQVYSELEVLAEINPNFPGIQDQIRRLEIALNLRENPVDQARINRAGELYRRAQSLADGTRDQAIVAVSLLEDAVELNPNASDAKFLLDQLRIRLGGQATVALSAADEQQYRRAETLFSQGRVLQALQITERLLEDADNQAYPPLVELRRRIALRLGI